MVSFGCGVGRFDPMVMVVEKGDNTQVRVVFSNISVLQSIPLCCIVRQLGENGN
jgi:hypothetical protein